MAGLARRNSAVMASGTATRARRRRRLLWLTSLSIGIHSIALGRADPCRPGSPAGDKIGPVVLAHRPRLVDIGNPALAIECPRCGLVTQRFLTYCRNCGFSLWPDDETASAAFLAWRDADPGRAEASRFDLELEPAVRRELVDYEERAHRLGIHIFPSSPFPIVICVGFLFLALAAVPFATTARVALAVIGLVIFLVGVVGWVVLEDVRMYPHDETEGHGEGPGEHR